MYRSWHSRTARTRRNKHATNALEGYRWHTYIHIYIQTYVYTYVRTYRSCCSWIARTRHNMHVTNALNRLPFGVHTCTYAYELTYKNTYIHTDHGVGGLHEHDMIHCTNTTSYALHTALKGYCWHMYVHTYELA